ncbi:30S ribosomal protein S10 [Candidatus Bipolaricaulota bacterium]|nr:30S ribosomal protein S10 [Candidatus Bipolaricaulota bacterium]HBR10517.1 30S ribosomal protein S10 [Candidatus Acetothermia bacterium]
MARKRIRIKVRGYDHSLVDNAVRKVVTATSETRAQIVGPIPLPTEKRIYTVLRSPHIDKRSMEHFERRVHTRLIDIKEPTSETINALMDIELPTGIDIAIKV